MTTRWTRSDRQSRSVSPRAVFWWTLALNFLISTCWVFGNPLTASPDEPAHAIKAAAVVRGQFLGDEAGAPIGSGWVEVPALFADIQYAPTCFAFQPAVPASCVSPPSGDLAAPTRTLTSAVRYSPTYYLVAGLPSLLGSSEFTLYAMRLTSALLCALLLALALRTLAEQPRPNWLMLGAAAGITPMVTFLNSSINPQGVEISSALLVWVSLAALLRDPGSASTGRLLGRLTIGVVFLATTRSLGPLFLLTIVAVVVLISPWRHLVELVRTEVIRTRRGRPYLAVCVLACAASLAWITGAGALSVDGDRIPFAYLTPRYVLTATLTRTSEYIENALGIFGWGDTPLPGWAYLLLAMPIVLLLLLALTFGGRRERIAVLGLGAVIFVLPFVAQFNQAKYINLFWQGRYALPLIVGLPIMAALACSHLATQLPAWFTDRLTAALFVLVGALQVLSFLTSLRRNVNGENGGYFRAVAGSWLPPVNAYLLVVLIVLGWAGLFRVWFRAATAAPPVDASTQATADA